ncbi:unnamed protein product [Oppiella nova]|uniref:Cytochrome P450 n=1 Tax=Oppiella nova TaxID=334625 RepID=A0A7R9ME89_9ACAR|nr:unnamed protein product [Oppiella nova]CAG2174790.1 unnamed protein product [Oppiella nova]
MSILLTYRFTYWSRHGVKGPKRIGIEGFFMKVSDFYTKNWQKYGRIFGAYDLFGKWLIVNEPELLRDILVKDFHIFPDHLHFNLGNTNLAKALFFLNGNDEEWKRIRTITSPSFTSGKLRAMMGSIGGIADQFVKNLDEYAVNGKTADMRKYMGAFAMDVISACAYGINVESINNANHPIVVNAKKILSVDTSFSFMLSILCPSIARFFKLEPFNVNAINFFNNLTEQIVAERKSAMNTDC